MKPAAFSRAAPFDPRFVERSALFWPVARAALALCGPQGEGSPFHSFPAVESFGRVFDPLDASKGDPQGAPRGAGQEPPPPVRFVASPPRIRPRRGRRREAIVVRDLYDARITLDRVVPTRPDSWHDLMNALVWGTFPRAKLALHARQHRAIAERIAPDARTLPPTRTRELDALALLDEGGVVLPWGDASRPVVFGHAIYESLALGIPPAIVAGVRIDLDIERALRTPLTIDALPAIDAALARFIGDPARLQTPEGLSRIELADA